MSFVRNIFVRFRHPVRTAKNIAALFKSWTLPARMKYIYHGDMNDSLLRYTWEDVSRLQWILSEEKYRRIVKKIFDFNLDRLSVKGGKVKICFVVNGDTAWSFDNLCRLLYADGRFDTFVLAIKHNDLDFSSVKKFLETKEMPVYDTRDERWHEADIFIYQNLYFHNCMDKLADIFNMGIGKLCLIIPYAIFQGDDDDEHLETARQSPCVWRFYCYTNDIFQYGVHKNIIGSLNMRLSGYPKMDAMYEPVKDMPNWTLENTVHILFAPSMAWRYSSFMSVKDVMLEIAEAMGNVSWIFRPHPLLGTSLINNGQIKSLEEYESYLNRWRNLPNASVQIGGDYMDTFKTSDAMIADGTTFLTNYQYARKPLLYIRCGREENLSEYGKKLYDCLYICDDDYNETIRHFVNDVVIGGRDILKEKREKFFLENLDYRKMNGCMASEYIYRDIRDAIFSKKEDSQ